MDRKYVLMFILSIFILTSCSDDTIILIDTTNGTAYNDSFVNVAGDNMTGDLYTPQLNTLNLTVTNIFMDGSGFAIIDSSGYMVGTMSETGALSFTPEFVNNGIANKITVNLGSGFGSVQTGQKIIINGDGFLQDPVGLHVDISNVTGIIHNGKGIRIDTSNNGGSTYGEGIYISGLNGIGQYIYSTSTATPIGIQIQDDFSSFGKLIYLTVNNADFAGNFLDFRMNQDSKQANFIRFEKFNSGDFNGVRYQVDAAGNVISLGSLIYPRGTNGKIENLLRHSENYTASSWTSTSKVVITPNAASSPDLVSNNADSFDTTIGSVKPQTVQIIPNVETANKEFIVQGYIRTKNSGFPTVQFWLNSSNEAGEPYDATNSQDLNRWKFFKFNQSFSGSSTENITLGFGTTINNFDLEYDLWGLQISESADTIGYTATANASVTARYGGSVNGEHFIGGDNTPTSLEIREATNQGEKPFLNLTDKNAKEKFVIDSNWNVNANTNITMNEIFGTMYQSDQSTTVTVTSIGVYYNITGMSSDYNNGFTYSSSTLTAIKDGLYKFIFNIGMSNGAGNTNFHLAPLINGINSSCITHLTTQGMNDEINAGGICTLRLIQGDQITLGLANIDSTDNANVESAQLDIEWRGH